VVVVATATPAAALATHGGAHQDGQQALLVLVERTPERLHGAGKGAQPLGVLGGAGGALVEARHQVGLGLGLLLRARGAAALHLGAALFHARDALVGLGAERLLDGRPEALLIGVELEPRRGSPPRGRR
jgi:hypothetical protein